MSALASPELIAFVHKQAPPHYATADAPSNWRQLKQWAVEQYRNEHADYMLPVWNGGSDNTIYDSPETNHAFRAWHDSIHLANDYSFSREDEIKVGLIHMQQVCAVGLSKRDQDMIVADTIGQIEYYYARGLTFVNDQVRFVSDVLKLGLKAVLDSGKIY